MKKFFTASQVAKILGVHRATVSNWAKQGRIAGAYKIATVWQIPEDSIDNIDIPEMGRPKKVDDGNEYTYADV